MKITKYMVMRLNTEIIQDTGYGGEQSIKLGGCAGYIPVFNTFKQAKKYAGKKYQILIIKIGKQWKKNLKK